MIDRERPSEDEAVLVSYGADRDVIVEAMVLEDGTVHMTPVTLDPLRLDNQPEE